MRYQILALEKGLQSDLPVLNIVKVDEIKLINIVLSFWFFFFFLVHFLFLFDEDFFFSLIIRNYRWHFLRFMYVDMIFLIEIIESQLKKIQSYIIILSKTIDI